MVWRPLEIRRLERDAGDPAMVWRPTLEIRGLEPPGLREAMVAARDKPAGDRGDKAAKDSCCPPVSSAMDMRRASCRTLE